MENPSLEVSAPAESCPRGVTPSTVYPFGDERARRQDRKTTALPCYIRLLGQLQMLSVVDLPLNLPQDVPRPPLLKSLTLPGKFC